MDIQNIDLNKVDVEALKTNLRDNEIDFGNRSGPERLVSLAIENEVEIPLKGGDVIEAGEEGDEDESRNIIPEKYRKKYGKNQNCGDDVALVLKDYVTGEGEDGKSFLDMAKLREVADQNKVDFERWAHLNPGMQRMNLGNVLRARVNRNEEVKVGTRVWEAVEDDEEDENKASKMG